MPLILVPHHLQSLQGRPTRRPRTVTAQANQAAHHRPTSSSTPTDKIQVKATVITAVPTTLDLPLVEQTRRPRSSSRNHPLAAPLPQTAPRSPSQIHRAEALHKRRRRLQQRDIPVKRPVDRAITAVPLGTRVLPRRAIATTP